MAWTITVTHDESVRMKHFLGGDRMEVVKFACTSDATGGTITLKHRDADPANDYVHIMDVIRGSWLYLFKYVPAAGGSAPAGTADIDVEDKNNDHILDTDANANDATTFVVGSDTLGVYPPIMNEITVVFATLGDTKKADLYLYFLK